MELRALPISSRTRLPLVRPVTPAPAVRDQRRSMARHEGPAPRGQSHAFVEPHILDGEHAPTASTIVALAAYRQATAARAQIGAVVDRYA